ncbi:MAG TPA: response regulator [Gammaproteobacteria bacterium]|nr:response regulator [Gammaproteobacteria bacterium]HJP38286.1 response regulator [Gammaproteobacteria bacterium]
MPGGQEPQHTILVVDDEELIVQEIVEALEFEGFEAIGVVDVDSALAVVSDQDSIRLIITDLRMPGKSGTDLIHSVKGMNKHDISFIVISGHIDLASENQNEALKHLKCILRKPINIDLLLDQVRETMS